MNLNLGVILGKCLFPFPNVMFYTLVRIILGMTTPLTIAVFPVFSAYVTLALYYPRTLNFLITARLLLKLPEPEPPLLDVFLYRRILLLLFGPSRFMLDLF